MSTQEMVWIKGREDTFPARNWTLITILHPMAKYPHWLILYTNQKNKFPIDLKFQVSVKHSGSMEHNITIYTSISQFQDFSMIFWSSLFLKFLLQHNNIFFIDIFRINPIKATGNAALPVLYLGFYYDDCWILSLKEGNQLPEMWFY